MLYLTPGTYNLSPLTFFFSLFQFLYVFAF